MTTGTVLIVFVALVPAIISALLWMTDAKPKASKRA